MSQRSRRRNFNASSQSQMNASSSSGGSVSLGTPEESEDYDQYTVMTVKFILNHLAARLPIKRADLVKECCNGSSKIFMIIQPAVQNRLKSIYGIILHELTSVKSGGKQYICFEKNPAVSMIKMRKCERQNQTLLLIILSYIFTKGESVSEGVMKKFLERLDIDMDKEHEWFGDVKKCLETFRKQLYLKREKMQSEATSEEKISIEWGERALMEFDKKTMLINIAEVFHKPTLYFKKQHMELMIDDDNMEVDSSQI
ncbi:non-structural maintenance of chromosomes element 3 homolog [Bradysia coprophila]|uniref:non-structural maintenance of chromosomes element 3 homolog n=1 Tax=Bradysia coprophila TaxID=38358 RepID=UPI00187D733C|nr:non-structural maintenance of chromosomes element 3 homolog [Bradysia coprophila]